MKRQQCAYQITMSDCDDIWIQSTWAQRRQYAHDRHGSELTAERTIHQGNEDRNAKQMQLAAHGSCRK